MELIASLNRQWLIVLASCVLLIGASTQQCAAQSPRVELSPTAIRLVGRDAQQQLLLSQFASRKEADATMVATFSSADSNIAVVDKQGVVRPVRDGATTITARLGKLSASIRVTVAQAGISLPVSFTNDIEPLLSKASCNSGGCHGKQAGRNGFKLSLFGFDPDFDLHTLTSESRGRRIFPADPEKSLLLGKASNRIPHGGGRRFPENSREYQQLVRWIKQGMLSAAPAEPTLVGIEMTPSSRVLDPRTKQRVIVTATYSDESTRDVTHLALYESNAEGLATVDDDGLVSISRHGGEAAIMASYMGYVDTFRVTVPMNFTDEPAAQLASWDSKHFIDQLVAAKWKKLNLAPSTACDDATFVRRVFLDCIGRLPNVEETRSFQSDKAADKRTRLVDHLLDRPEYADYQALQWADLLRVNPEQLGAKRAMLLDRWLRKSFRANMRYDEFVRALMTAQGSSLRELPVNFYKGFAKPNDLTIAVSQIFLGVRLECAQCHHHPYEKWGQGDFYGLAAFFPRLTRKRGTNGEELLYAGIKGDVKHPRTGKLVTPQVLGGEPYESEPGVDRRIHLADWMTRRDNPFVARALVNRVWAHYMGRGIVEPVDDMRDTNPATNDELLDALAADFVKHDFDLKHLIRTITSAKAYGLSSLPNRWNVLDTNNFSRAYRKRLSAEVLLDAVCDVTETKATFVGMPPGTRAVQLWNNRLPSGFLDVFGRPERKTVCECERTSETSLAQVLHLMNAPLVNDRIQSSSGRVARLVGSKRTTDEIIEELYLATLNRSPNEREFQSARGAFADPESNRRQAAEDVMWALLNTAEFVLNH